VSGGGFEARASAVGVDFLEMRFEVRKLNSEAISST